MRPACFGKICFEEKCLSCPHQSDCSDHSLGKMVEEGILEETYKENETLSYVLNLDDDGELAVEPTEDWQIMVLAALWGVDIRETEEVPKGSRVSVKGG